MKRNSPTSKKGIRQRSAVTLLEERLKLGDEQLLKTSAAVRKGRAVDAKTLRAELQAHLTHLKAHVS